MPIGYDNTRNIEKYNTLDNPIFTGNSEVTTTFCSCCLRHTDILLPCEECHCVWYCSHQCQRQHKFIHESLCKTQQSAALYQSTMKENAINETIEISRTNGTSETKTGDTEKTTRNRNDQTKTATYIRRRMKSLRHKPFKEPYTLRKKSKI